MICEKEAIFSTCEKIQDTFRKLLIQKHGGKNVLMSSMPAFEMKSDSQGRS